MSTISCGVSNRPDRFGQAIFFALFLTIAFLFPTALFSADASANSVIHPAWSRDLAIYEVNIRQYTPGGTFREFEEHLPRLKDMGIGILWLMPIHPIGEKNRKGPLGSYYSVKDYMAVNPEFGTLDEFKTLVRHSHDLGMYVIIDWVANHAAWDNALAVTHPEWFTKDSTGSFAPPVPDWTDVIDLDYNQPGLRSYMTDAMKYWVTETDIDGFRCDVAGMVPMDFWDSVRVALDKIKPVFMLAEDEQPQCHYRAFDMTYGWELMHLMNDIAKRQKLAADLSRYFVENRKRYPDNAYRMYFTSNHDENSWNGTEFERLGAGVAAFAVLSMTVRGMPLIYSGQEAELNQRLRFFDKDTIVWRSTPMDTLYRKSLILKRENPALWNGIAGGEMTIIPTTHETDIFAFCRERDSHVVLAIFNFSDSTRAFELLDNAPAGDFIDPFHGEKTTLRVGQPIALPPWEYRVLVR